MKVLVVISSLRKKHTYEAAKRFEEAHKLYGTNCDYEYVFIKDLDFKLCNGCFLCISKGEAYCPLKDDRDMLIEKIGSADCIVLASPNYVMNVNWLTKNLIDRFAYNLHRPTYFDKRFVLLLSSGNYMGTKQAFKAMSVLASGGKVIGKLVMYTAPELSEKRMLKQEKAFYKKTSRIFKILDKPYVHKPPFVNLLWFASFKATHELCKNTLPADYEYYKDKEYFTDTDLSIVQRFVTKCFTSLFKSMS